MENTRSQRGHGEHPGRHYPPRDFGPTLADGRACPRGRPYLPTLDGR